MLSKLFSNKAKHYIIPDKRANIIIKLENTDKNVIERIAKDGTRKPFNGVKWRNAEKSGDDVSEYEYEERGNDYIYFEIKNNVINVYHQKHGFIGKVINNQFDKVKKLIEGQYFIYWVASAGRLLSCRAYNCIIYDNDYEMTIRIYKI